jgi:hypothetical protein
MKNYREFKRQHMLKQITDEEYQKEKEAMFESLAKQLTDSKETKKTE